MYKGRIKGKMGNQKLSVYVFKPIEKDNDKKSRNSKSDSEYARFLESKENEPQKKLINKKQDKQKSPEGLRNGKSTKQDVVECSCKKGDPIDMASGAFIYEGTDFILPEMSYDFRFVRQYNSMEDKKGRKSIGYKWMLSVDTSICQYDDDTIVILPDSKSIEFKFKDGYYINKRGNKKYELKRPKDDFIFEDNENRLTYIYDEYGTIKKILDKNKNTTRFIHCEYGIKQVILSTGLSLTFEWEAMKISKVYDNTGRQVEYHYENGILTEVVRCDGTTLKYSYDDNNNILNITDGNGTTYLYNEYDEKGRVKSQRLTDGSFTSYEYDDVNRTNTYRDEVNNITIKYVYDERKDIVEEIFEDGTSIKTIMSKEGFIEEKISRNGARTRYKYDEYGHILMKDEPSGLITEYVYENKNLKEVSDNEGRREEHTYDENGNVLISKIETGKNSSGNKLYLIKNFAYDTKGRLLRVTENDVIKEEYIYEEANGNPVEVRKNGETFKKNIYDECLRIISIETEQGVETYEYTEYNKIKKYVNSEGEQKSFYYDNAWRLIKKVKSDNNKSYTIEDKGEKYIYDDMDRLISIEDETGRTVSYIRNTNGDITEEIRAEKTVVTYDYDKDFNVIRRHIYVEDKTYTERYFYDADGEMIRKVLPSDYDIKIDDGAAFEYKRDRAGRVIEVYNPEGYITDTYTYDKRGNVLVHKHSFNKKNDELNAFIKSKDNAGDLYKYDVQGKMTEKRQLIEIKENGQLLYNVTRYIYNAKEELIKEYTYLDAYTDEEEPNGEARVVTREYNLIGRLVQISDNSGASIKYEYDKVGNVIKETKKIYDEKDEITEYEYDNIGRVISKVQKEATLEEKKAFIGENKNNGQVVGVRRNRFVTLRELEEKNTKEKVIKEVTYVKVSYKNGKVDIVSYPEGSKEKYSYDKAGRKESVQILGKDNKEYKVSYKYDEYGYLSEEDKNGIVVLYKNDVQGNRIEEVKADGGKTIYEYDWDSKLIKVISPKENESGSTKGTSLEYDHNGQLIKVTSPYDIVLVENKYDLYGKVIERNFADGEGISHIYNLIGKPILAKTKEGIRQEYAYDALGNLKATATGHEITRYENDIWGRVTRIMAPEGVTESYKYDYKGNIIEATDGEGRTTGYKVNTFGKLCELTYADGKKEIFSYDMEGNVKTHTKRSGNVISYSYDSFGNVEKYGTDTDYYQYEYDAVGRIKTAKSSGITYNYIYDVCGRLQEKKACGRSLVSYTYDLNGNVSTVKDATGKEIKYTYDLENRLQTVAEGDNTLATYEYTKGGKISTIICGDVKTSYEYDLSGNRTDIRVTIGEENLTYMSYRYDDRGNCILKNTSNEGIYDDVNIEYAYDGLNRLVGEKLILGQNVSTYSYAYDKAGNRKSLDVATSIVDGADALSRKHVDYTYNSLNQLETVNDINAPENILNLVYDADGNLTSDGKGIYEYDVFGHMSTAKLDNKETLICRYDAEGLRYEVEENERLIKYIYRGKDIAVEENEDDGATRYIRGNGRLIASDSEKARTYYHYVSDNVGSICYVVNGGHKGIEGNKTDGLLPLEDRIQCHYEYDAFGNIVKSEEKIRNIYRFTGEQYDQVTGQYYLKARYYNPVIGRFTQMDTYLGDGLNLYAYVQNNPVKYVDPSGHSKICSKGNGVESGNSSVLDNANYAQKTYGNRFSEKGIQKYTEIAGEPINTIDDLVNAINVGKVNVNDIPVEYIIRDGNTLILNTRTSQALTRAGIPRNQWKAIDRTGNIVFEDMLDGQLSRNKLTSEGIVTVRPSGGKK